MADEVSDHCQMMQNDVPFESAEKSVADERRNSARGGECYCSTHRETTESLKYAVTDAPAWYACVVLGLQHFVTVFVGQVGICTIISTVICMEWDFIAKAKLLNTIVFGCGISTVLQILIGSRLPFIQGSAAAYLAPVIALTSLPEWKCRKTMSQHMETSLFNTSGDNIRHNQISNYSNITGENGNSYLARMCEIQGALIVAGLFEILFGASGIVGLLVKIMSPLVISVVITLVAVPVFQIGIKLCSKCWPVAGLTFCLIAMFAQVFRKVKVPLPGYSKQKKCHIIRYPVFLVLPIVIGVFISWLMCFILTEAGALGKSESGFGYSARTDTKLSVMKDTPWIHVPYPCQWGIPRFSPGVSIGMMSAVLASIMESLGDYYTCARLSNAPPPPAHAINRGITVEGVGVLLSGLIGTGIGTTSYSENIAYIAITKVGSRKVFIYAGLWMVALGIFGKFGAIFATVPEPIIGGMLIVTIGYLMSAGLSNLQFVNLNTSRNMFVLGVSLGLGLAVPLWIKSLPTSLKTGSPIADQILAVLLQSNMLIGGLVALCFDNCLQGTDSERGLEQWKIQTLPTNGATVQASSIYNLPYGNKCMKYSCMGHVPICPRYENKIRFNNYNKNRE